MFDREIIKWKLLIFFLADVLGQIFRYTNKESFQQFLEQSTKDDLAWPWRRNSFTQHEKMKFYDEAI